jgi:hypothetical protein
MMIDKRKIRLYKKLVILIICFFILIRIFALTLSKYESTTSSDANIDIAFYVLNEDYQAMTLNLDSLFPQDELYEYTFSISNEKDGHVAETNLKYNLQIRTTTNLPLSFKLYMNDGNEDIITESKIVQEDDGYDTYFLKMSTEEQYFFYDTAKTNTYKLTIEFPAKYNTVDYQDIIEALEINVASEQITE